MPRSGLIALIFLATCCLSGRISAQEEWEFVTEKDGIKVYTRQENGTNFKSFKGETDLMSTVAEVLAIVQDVEKFSDWDEDISQIKIIEQEKDKTLKYYVVYNVPWPFKDRDLVVDAQISTDSLTGTGLVIARSAPDSFPVDEELVRIMAYHQKWVIQPLANGIAHLTLEGYADPAGDIPAWIANLAITDTPLNMLRAIRESLE
jgi:hypothetical protein